MEHTVTNVLLQINSQYIKLELHLIIYISASLLHSFLKYCVWDVRKETFKTHNSFSALKVTCSNLFDLSVLQEENSSVPLVVNPHHSIMTKEEEIPDWVGAQEFYAKYEPKEILGRWVR